MQPFSIQCVTCKSKLTVSKPALLEQILVCPKCNSMVQIPESHPSETEILAPASDSPEVFIAQQHDDHTDTVEDSATLLTKFPREVQIAPTTRIQAIIPLPVLTRHLRLSSTPMILSTKEPYPTGPTPRPLGNIKNFLLSFHASPP